ncbi:response regulator transcription factor [Nocardioides panaciterrulae]|uniref:DNA-binding response OmpR family regulator n=1 Tax=Nocardioides panaciterrulae TaxID=661492 RepID=A0A7Y9E7I9_9ACTN|nr:response regulator transcription factor [Nocardioides panaciterrulae]NYD42641.1 DNA-binding response OmpR family regulator [Nocardioides panaciterrulae]
MRILVVEDDKRVASAVRRGLQEHGYAVDVALTGTDGHWLATENAYDAIVLDSMLPGMSGEEICNDLREQGDWTPILILTARSGAAEEATALDAGADDFLAKPFSYVVLLARLRALLRRGGKERPAVLTAGDLRLDPATHRAWRGDAELALTPRQFSLLEFLLRRKGEVLPKSEILAHVWDFTFDGDPNIVEVYVRQLRTRIDEPFGRASVQTVRLVGYRMDPDGG